VGDIVHSGASGVRKVDTLFFKFGWSWCGFNKKRAETRYTKLVFLHPVGSAGHVVHSGASGARNVDALFFMLGWNWYGIDKNSIGKLMFLHLTGSTSHLVHSGASGA
jgi:hypothetical protein